MAIRWGMIGCGDVTERKSGPAFAKVRGSELVAVMRRTPGLAEDYARRHGVARWYDDVDAILADSKVNAVYIATPPGSHCQLALRVAEVGKPCYVEKPMARCHDECRQMIDAFAAADLPLWVAYYRRALPRFLYVRQLLNQQRLGKIVRIAYEFSQPIWPDFDRNHLKWRVLAEQSGGGLLFDVGSHALDLLDFFFGSLEEVSGCAANVATPHDVEDSVTAHFVTQDGSPGVAHWDFSALHNIDRLRIKGTRASLSFSIFGHEPIELQSGEGLEKFPFDRPEHVQQPMIQTIVDALAGNGPCTGTGESGARTSLVLDAITRDYYGGRGEGFWQRPDAWPGRRQAR